MKAAHYSPLQASWIKKNEKKFYTMARAYIDEQLGKQKSKDKPVFVSDGLTTFERMNKRRDELILKSTKAEIEFYGLMDLLGIRYEKQYPLRFKTNQFFADVYFPDIQLVAEIDGGYHDTKEQKKADKQRTAVLERNGYRVVRFKNEQIKDRVSVLSTLSGHGLKIDAREFI